MKELEALTKMLGVVLAYRPKDKTKKKRKRKTPKSPNEVETQASSAPPTVTLKRLSAEEVKRAFISCHRLTRDCGTR